MKKKNQKCFNIVKRKHTKVNEVMTIPILLG